MGWLCGLLAVVAVVALWLLARSPHYSRIFSDDHVVEFSRALSDMKPALLAHIDDEDAGEVLLLLPGDLRTMQTSPGLFAAYTITKRGGRYAHHFSLRDRQGYTAAAVGTTFGIIAALVLGVDPKTLRVGRSENTVYHVEFELDEDQQRAFAERPPREVTRENARALHDEAIKARDLFGFEHITTGLRFAR